MLKAIAFSGSPLWAPMRGELIAAVQAAMRAGQPYTLLRDAIFTHYTISEGLKAILAGVPQQAPEKREYARSAGQKRA